MRCKIEVEYGYVCIVEFYLCVGQICQLGQCFVLVLKYSGGLFSVWFDVNWFIKVVDDDCDFWYCICQFE